MIYIGLLLIAFLHGGGALEVKIFRDVEFRGLIYEHTSKTSDCINLPGYGMGFAGSIETDTCLMIYEDIDCEGFSSKVSLDSDMSDLRKDIYSFHTCNEEYGGGTIKVDFIDNNNELLVEYNDICGCQDLPSKVSTNIKRVNNYGNCITVYETSECTGDKEDIQAGMNGRSQNLPELGYYVRSISACGSRSNCIKLNAETYKFEIHMNNQPQNSTEELKLGQKTSFFNNGSATVSQEYIAKRTIQEKSVVKKSSSFKQFEGYKTAKWTKVDVKVGASIPIPDTTLVVDIGLSVGYAASAAYGSGRSEEEKESEEFTHIEEKEFVARQTFEVPPCTEYEVSSAVKMVEDYPIEYDVYSLVTGMASGRRLTAEEVKERVDTMTFVGYYDEYTAEFMTSGVIQANVGYETVISGEGNYIQGCVWQ